MKIAWATLLVALLSGVAAAQEFKPDPVDETAAKRERKVTWYTSTAVAAGQHIARQPTLGALDIDAPDLDRRRACNGQEEAGACEPREAPGHLVGFATEIPTASR